MGCKLERNASVLPTDALAFRSSQISPLLRALHFDVFNCRKRRLGANRDRKDVTMYRRENCKQTRLFARTDRFVAFVSCTGK